MLFATLFSVFTEVEYVLPKDDSFYMSPAERDQPYFKVNEDGEVPYKNLYRLVQRTSLDAAEMCDPTPRQDTRDLWVEIPDASSLSGIDDIWRGLCSSVVGGRHTATKMSTKDEAMSIVNVAENVNITAPAAGETNISHYVCDDDSTMEYLITWSDGNIYTVTISDARCWHYCAHKSVPEGESYTATTSGSLKGKVMRAGDVPCVGKGGATISIVCTNT